MRAKRDARRAALYGPGSNTETSTRSITGEDTLSGSGVQTSGVLSEVESQGIKPDWTKKDDRLV